jgi:hypothetical protein
MKFYGRSDRWSNVLFWAAMAITPFVILSSGHGRLQHFVTGAAAAIFLVSVVRLGQRRRCMRG